MFNEPCKVCGEEIKSPYTFRDSKGEWHYAHKYCCNSLKRQIEEEYQATESK